MVFKRQQFKDNKSEEMESRDSKRQQLYVHGNEEGESLDKFEDEKEEKGIKYVLFRFVAPL